MSEGLSFPKSNAFADDPKLALALDLYAAYFTEQSTNARFLTLIMALEALTIDMCRAHSVLPLLKRWLDEVKQLMKELDSKSDDAKSLQALTGERLLQGKESVQKQIHNLVVRTLQDVPGVDATQLADTAKKLYAIRSPLLHNGKVDLRDDSEKLNRATSDARCLVHLILTTKFKNLMGDPHATPKKPTP